MVVPNYENLESAHGRKSNLHKHHISAFYGQAALAGGQFF
jgi:hypothetical protein